MTNSNVLQASFQCSAKINWDLYITGTRPDSYHEIDSVVAPINLYDEIDITISDGSEISVESDICPGKDNLCWKAADLFCRYLDIKKSIKIKITKHIPHGAGLGGGSSDAACVIKGLDKMLETGLLARQLNEIAQKVGSDVPCFLYDGWRRMRGRGEIVEEIEGQAYTIILVKPAGSVSTPLAYKYFDEHCKPTSKPDANRFENPKNDLLIPAEMIEPEIEKVMGALKVAGAKPYQMTGSGSACYGVFESREQADKACKIMAEKWSCWSLTAGV